MRRSLLVLSLVLALGACVYTHTTDLVVPPPGIRVPQGGADTVGLKVSVSDARSNKASIGTLRSSVDQSYKYVVVPSRPIEDAVGLAIKSEFAARGYRLGDGPAFLLVDIEAADSSATWYLMRTDVMGEAALAAHVYDANGLHLFTRTYKGREKGSNSVLIGGYDEGKVQLEKVLAAAIREMSEDGDLVQALISANGVR